MLPLLKGDQAQMQEQILEKISHVMPNTPNFLANSLIAISEFE